LGGVAGTGLRLLENAKGGNGVERNCGRERGSRQRREQVEPSERAAEGDGQTLRPKK